MLSDQTEHRCQTIDISVSGAALRAPIAGRVGEEVVCYLDQFGRLEGRIARLFDDGFAVDFVGTASRREKLAAQLARTPYRPTPEAPSARRHDRIEPRQRRAVLKLADGRHIATQVVNLSRSGVAINCQVPLAVGDSVMIGRRQARVARVLQRLMALEFDKPIAESDFTADIVL